MPQRRLPRPAELRELLRPRRWSWRPRERRLSRANSIAELRAIAARCAPRAVFDYTDGAAESEIGLRRAREAFARVEFRPSVLRGAAEVDTSIDILGQRSALPFALAPTGFTRMMQHEGERAVARVAQREQLPYTLSTMGTTSIEDVAAAAPDARRWFQLYVWHDRDAARDLISRARDCGYDTLMLTVDTPVAGARLRDVRNGLTVPPALTLRTFADGARHPAWWFNLLTTEPLTFASLTSWPGTVAELINEMFDPTLSYEDLEWVRAQWPGHLVVKGIQNAADAAAVVDRGVDAVLLSNHGGRQLDRAPVPLELVPEAVDAVGGRAEVWVDTGISNGADIVAALAMGADACLVGRAYLYGLMAGGQEGVQRAVEILRSDIVRTMHLLGVRDVGELTPEHAVLR